MEAGFFQFCFGVRFGPLGVRGRGVLRSSARCWPDEVEVEPDHVCLKIALEDLVRVAHVSAEKISPLRPSAVLSAMAADLWSPRIESSTDLWCSGP